MSDTTSAPPHQWAVPARVRPNTVAWNFFHWAFSKCVLSHVCQQSPFEFHYCSVCGPKASSQALSFPMQENFLQYLEEGTRKHGSSIAEPINQGWAVLVCQLSCLGAHWCTVGLSSLYFLWRTSRCRGKGCTVQFSPRKRVGICQECTQARNTLIVGEEKGIREHFYYLLWKLSHPWTLKSCSSPQYA